MSATSAFVESLHEVFEPFGRIEAKRMFGGHGIYHEGRMFALVADDVLYLKADGESVTEFDRLNLRPFAPTMKGKTVSMSYREAPVEIFEDRAQAALWARRAWEAALRSGQPQKKKKAPRAPAHRAGRSAR